METNDFLHVNNIQVVYNDVILALRGISLRVPERGIVALLGANGAGKSTTLKAVSGLINKQNGKLVDGDIVFRGRSIAHLDPDAVVRMGIGLVPEGRRVFSDLTVAENLWIGAHTRRVRAEAKTDVELLVGYFPALKSRLKQRGLFLSGGEQQMLAIARGLMARPRLLMLDEPSLGLAPLLVGEIFSILDTINREQEVAILLIEQNAGVALAHSGYGYIMENGKIVLDGPSPVLTENEDVQEFYLGRSEETGKKNYADVKHYKRRKRWLS